MPEQVLLYYDPASEDQMALARHVEQVYLERGYVVRQVPTVALIGTKPPIFTPPPLGPSNTGLDLSHWNDDDTELSVAQFNLIKQAGHMFVWIKRTQGKTFVDKHGKNNMLNALTAGGLWVGPMHFFEWDVDGAEQIRHHSRECGENTVGTFYPLLDFELVPGAAPLTNAQKLSCEANLRKALAEYPVLFMGRKPVIYTSRHYWLNMLIPHRVIDIIKNYMFLIADLEGPLDLLPPGMRKPHFRQKSHTYTIPGIVGPIDLDEYLGEPPAIVPHSMAHLTNQQVINLFASTFGGLNQLARVNPNWANDMAVPVEKRALKYAGPAIEDSALFYQEMDQLIAKLAV